MSETQALEPAATEQPLPTINCPEGVTDDYKRLMAGYVSACLFAGNIVSHARSLLSSAVQSPHSKERMIVFRDEFLALERVTPKHYASPSLDEAMRLNDEIRLMMLAKREAESAKATLLRIAADIEKFMPDNQTLAYGDVEKAGELLAQLRDLARTELRHKPTEVKQYPSESEVAGAYFPVKVTNVDQLKVGDCVFLVEKKTVLYQHGNPQEQTKVESVINLQGTVVMRPFGAQAVLALRWHRAVDITTRLASMCTDKKQKGRKEGLQTASELLKAPTWLLSPLPLPKV